jgi:hypothetical protein
MRKTMLFIALAALSGVATAASFSAGTGSIAGSQSSILSGSGAALAGASITGGRTSGSASTVGGAGAVGVGGVGIVGTGIVAGGALGVVSGAAGQSQVDSLMGSAALGFAGAGSVGGSQAVGETVSGAQLNFGPSVNP